MDIHQINLEAQFIYIYYISNIYITTNVGIFLNHENYAGASYENNDYGCLKFSPGSLQNRCEGSSNMISDFPRNIQSDSILSKIVPKSTQNL